MLTAHDAERLILDLAHPFDPERDREQVALSSALGRVLASSVVGALDVPHWDNSAMDGYAVRHADVEGATAAQPVTLALVEEIPAGYQPQKTVQPGQAARILTGSMMPTGADTVVMQEDTQREGDRVTILVAPKPQAFVRHQGAFYRAGDPLLALGQRLTAPEIAVLAAVQCVEVPVFRQLRVAILSTGDELVSPDQPLKPGQIVDSNQYALAAQVEQAGAIPLMLGVVPDRPDALKQAIEQAIAQADVVLSSGGVSVGDYDYVDQILAELGATLHIRAVAVKPGKPLTVATVGDPVRPTLYFGLPGNPVSALVSFWRFVQPALHKRSGLVNSGLPTWITAVTYHDLKSDGKRESYFWGQLALIDGTFQFRLAGGSHLSGNLINLAGTNALAMVPIGQTHISIGRSVQVMLVGALMQA